MGVQEHLGRPLRFGIAPVTTVILFGILLAYFFILYQPSRGPGLIQGLGRQAWELVSSPLQASDTDEYGLPLTVSPKPTNTPTPTNWWEAPVPTKPVDETGLPLKVWNPLLPLKAGLSEITVQRCMFPPALVGGICDPKSHWEESWSNGGSWVRVEPDLNRKAGFWYLNLYYRRTRRLDVPLITNITLLEKGQETTLDDPKNWTKVPLSVRDGVPGIAPLYLWYKKGPPLQEYHEENAVQHLITELDVLFGNAPAWYGFDKLSTPVTPGSPKAEPVWLTYRRGAPKPVPVAPPLHFPPEKNGTYKILQVADLHFSVGTGRCRDVALTPCSDADAMSTQLLMKTLDAEKPDLVIFTGDQLNGQGTSWDSKSVLTKFAREVIRRKIPWATVLGNHDDDDGFDRKKLMEHISQMPYSVASSGPEDVDGAGNYVLKIRSPDPSATHILTLYFLDSHGYITADFGVFKQIIDYDYLHQNQIDWFTSESAKIKPIVRPFKPDGASDTGHILPPRDADPAKSSKPAVVPPSTKLAKPNALMFYHIPVPQAFNPADVGADGKTLNIGNQFDADGGSKKDIGFFEHAILYAKEGSGDGKPEVKVVGNGHLHATDYCRRVKGVWFCFGGGGSYSAYGRLGFDRRFRVYEISDWGETIRSYKRTEFDEIIDDVVLVGKGAMGEGR